MSSTETEHKGREFEPHHQTHAHEHPSDMLYVKVAAFLAVVTALEVSTYFIFDDPWTPVNVVGLLVMMVIKFATVGAFFMHLRYDHPIFRRVFIAGLILAVIVYAIVFFAFEFFTDDFFRYLRD